MHSPPDPAPGDPWHQPGQGPGYPADGLPGWGFPPEQHSGGALEPYDGSIGGYEPGQAPGYGFPPQQHTGGALEPYGAPSGEHPSAGSDNILTTIGDIAISQSTVTTPSGRFPIKGTVWTVTDMSHTVRNTPTWAIVVALLVFWWTCLLGLLFLLVKEQRTVGHVQIGVQGHGKYHSTSIPVHHPGAAMHINEQVNYARSLAA